MTTAIAQNITQITDRIAVLETAIAARKAEQNMSCYWEYFDAFQRTIDQLETKLADAQADLANAQTIDKDKNMTTTIELTRTDLTQYETEKLHLADRKVADHSLAVGAFMTRFGRPEVLQEAADLFLSLLDELVADTDIRTGALDYAMFMAECGMNDRHASQAYRLREEFQFDLYRAAISTREGNEARRVGA